MAITETSNWRSGKKTRKGRPVRVEPEAVTIVDTGASVEHFLGARGPRLRRHLRELRDAGLLVHEKGRLTQRVRVEAPGTRYGVTYQRCHVFRGRRDEIPRAARRAAVIGW